LPSATRSSPRSRKEFSEFVNAVSRRFRQRGQRRELGWGTHGFPRDGKRYDFGGSAIYPVQPGAATRDAH
jgi:homospermidine synthase